MEKDAIDLGKTNIYKLFGKYFFPTLLGMLCGSAVTTIDGIFVGHGVGSDGIAAVNICVPIFMLCGGVGLMVGAGCSVVSSIHFSRGKVKAARINVTQAILFSTLITAVPAFLMWLFPEATGRLLGASPELMPMVKDYLLWFVLFMPLSAWEFIALFIIRLDGSPRYAMWCSVVTAVLNTILDWLFIFPFGWGVMGAAFASSLSVAVGGLMAVGYLLFFAKTLRLIRLKVSRKSLHYTVRNIGYQCTIGSSALIGEATMAVLAFVGNHVFMHYLGNDGVGAFGIACYYTPFVFMVGNAIAQSAQPIISYNFGLGENGRVRQAFRLALLTAVTCGAIVTALFVLFPRQLVALFIDPSCHTAHIAISGFPYFAVAFIFFVVNLACVGYYQSIERVSKASCFSLLRGVVFLVPAFYLVPLFLGTEGIWLALAVSEVLTTLVVMAVHQSHRLARSV